MRKLFVSVLALAFLVPSGLPAQQKSPPLTNSDVVGMVKAGLTPDIVVAKIKSSRCKFDTSPAVLGELKKTGLPDSVILAMVEAPQGVQAEGSAKKWNPGANIVYVKCNDAPIGITSAANFVSSTLGTATCNETLKLLDSSDNLYSKIETEQGVIGYISSFALSRDKSQSQAVQSALQVREPEPPRPPATPKVPPNIVRAVAWRGVPWATTSYYQQPGTSSTDCTGSGQWMGDFYQSDLHCTGSYTPAQSVPISWQHYTIYNLVQTSGSYLVLSCTRNWAWSKCSYLIPGDSFPYEYKKGQIWVTGQRAGKKKEESLKYDIIASQPISH